MWVLHFSFKLIKDKKGHYLICQLKSYLYFTFKSRYQLNFALKSEFESQCVKVEKHFLLRE